MNNLEGHRQRPPLSQSPTLCRSGSVRAAHPRSQLEGSQDTRGLCRSRVERPVSTASSGQTPHHSLPRRRESSFVVLPLLSKSNPLRWASIWRWDTTGGSHPMLYRTHHHTIPNRDRHSPHIVHCPQSPAISRLSAAGAKEKAVYFIRKQAETAVCANG